MFISRSEIKVEHKHDEYCNCEDCWWARGQKEICPTCGCIVGEGCPCHENNS